jgi:hypothetical protein
MINTYSYLTPSINNIKLEPKIVQLYVPPIKWKGDPIGHVGKNDALFFVASGECCFIVDEVSFVAKAGELVFLPKDRMRSYTTVNESSLQLYEMNFVAEIDGVYWNDAIGWKKNVYSLVPRNPDVIRRLFEESVHYEMNKNIFYDFALCSNILQVLKEFIEVRLSIEKKSQPNPTQTASISVPIPIGSFIRRSTSTIESPIVILAVP